MPKQDGFDVPTELFVPVDLDEAKGKHADLGYFRGWMNEVDGLDHRYDDLIDFNGLEDRPCAVGRYVLQDVTIYECNKEYVVLDKYKIDEDKEPNHVYEEDYSEEDYSCAESFEEDMERIKNENGWDEDDYTEFETSFVEGLKQTVLELNKEIKDMVSKKRTEKEVKKLDEDKAEEKWQEALRKARIWVKNFTTKEERE